MTLIRWYGANKVFTLGRLEGFGWQTFCGDWKMMYCAMFSGFCTKKAHAKPQRCALDDQREKVSESWKHLVFFQGSFLVLPWPAGWPALPASLRSTSEERPSTTQARAWLSAQLPSALRGWHHHPKPLCFPQRNWYRKPTGPAQVPSPLDGRHSVSDFTWQCHGSRCWGPSPGRPWIMSGDPSPPRPPPF